MFDNDTPIDNNLLVLVKELKKYVKENPSIKITENNWIITMPFSWLNTGELSVSYYRFHRKPFRVWWRICGVDPISEDSMMQETVIFDTNLSTVSQVIKSLLLLWYTNNGIPQEVIDYLAVKTKNMTIESAIKTIGKETQLVLTIEQMKILGIEEERGRISGRKFGL
jgi:hypothetical protein